MAMGIPPDGVSFSAASKTRARNLSHDLTVLTDRHRLREELEDDAVGAHSGSEVQKFHSPFKA